MSSNSVFPRAEAYTYIVVWSAGLFYAFYHAYFALDGYCSSAGSSCSLEPGWFMNQSIERQGEWSTWFFFVFTILPWMFAHLIGAEIIRKVNIQYLTTWYVFISLVFSTWTLGVSMTCYMLVFPCAYFAVLHLRSKTAVWLLGGLFMYYGSYILFQWKSRFGDSLYYDLNIVFGAGGWLNLRAISFCLDHIAADKKPSLGGFHSLLAYSLYLPLLASGPPLLYEEFDKGVRKPYIPWTWSRTLTFLLALLRYGFWMLFVEIALHFFHFHTLWKHPQVILGLNMWALGGVTYLLGFCFMMTFVMAYGVASVFTSAEQISAPAHPICVAHVHLYSNMWRYFDRGLYLFMIKYIYVPCIGARKGFHDKMAASTVTFLFIYLFHGTSRYILVWTVLNYVEVTLEGIGSGLGSIPAYQRWETRWLSPDNRRRFYTMLGAPLQLISLISNMYFISNSVNVGNAFYTRFLESEWWALLVVFFFCYCCGQTALEVRRNPKSIACPVRR